MYYFKFSCIISNLLITKTNILHKLIYYLFTKYLVKQGSQKKTKTKKSMRQIKNSKSKKKPEKTILRMANLEKLQQ